jgi:hypothetical protein
MFASTPHFHGLSSSGEPAVGQHRVAPFHTCIAAQVMCCGMSDDGVRTVEHVIARMTGERAPSAGAARGSSGNT